MLRGCRLVDGVPLVCFAGVGIFSLRVCDCNGVICVSGFVRFATYACVAYCVEVSLCE